VVRFGSLLIGLVFTVSSAAAVAPADTTLAALRKASGCTAWGHLATLRVGGVESADGLMGRFKMIVDTRAGRSKEEMNRGPIREGDGFDGTTAWSRDYSGASHILNAPDAISSAITNAWLTRRGWCRPDDGGAVIRTGGTHTEGGRAFAVLEALPQGGAPVTMWVNRSTHLLDRTIQRFNENHEIDHFSNWSTVAGTPIAFEERVEDPEDQSVQTWSTTRVELLPPVPATSFARPKTPDDFHLLAGAHAAKVPYTSDGWKPILNVMLNGHGPFPFVIDTGGHFILTPATARRLRVVPVGNTNSAGTDPTLLKTRFAPIREVRIGNAIIKNQVAEIIPYNFSRLERGPRPPKAGWIGLEVFERFATTFDPNTRTITLAPLTQARPIPRGTRIPLLFSEDAPLVRCMVAAHPGLCMMDTGNSGRTIVEGHWAERTGLIRRLRRGLATGDGSWISRENVSIGSLGDVPQIVRYIPPTKFGAEATTVEAAILSEALIDNFVATFDYGRGAVWLQPAIRLAQRPFNRSGIEADKERDGTFVVSHVFPGSPAGAAKVGVGDHIVAVDSRSASQFSGADFAAANEGQIGALRSYRVLSHSDGRPRTVTLRLRELLPLRLLEAKQRVNHRQRCPERGCQQRARSPLGPFWLQHRKTPGPNTISAC